MFCNGQWTHRSSRTNNGPSQRRRHTLCGAWSTLIVPPPALTLRTASSRLDSITDDSRSSRRVTFRAFNKHDAGGPGQFRTGSRSPQLQHTSPNHADRARVPFIDSPPPAPARAEIRRSKAVRRSTSHHLFIASAWLLVGALELISGRAAAPSKAAPSAGSQSLVQVGVVASPSGDD